MNDAALEAFSKVGVSKVSIGLRRTRSNKELVV
jgi:hypothetical protein